ncbi:hypothetical protein [Shewanella xiamenensis]|uniref:hypothetical protein n=1 Tax=Shewanella xiamenensis TaxID=332186 RepID=UPI0021BEC707|nr:hypothetical protein [Shewanella xiamenensis]MCT8873762.1 hypothetical protein [Shewanella xiamenensis]
MPNRMKMNIIVLPDIKMLHFTEKSLAGLRNEAWYPYSADKLFEYVELYLVEAGIAINVTQVNEIRRCGLSIDYSVIYNSV